MSEHLLSVEIHMLDGNVYKYFTDDEGDADHTLKLIQPNRLFSQKQLVLAGTYYMAGFNADEITRIDVIAGNLPSWNLPAGIKDLFQVDEEMLDRRAMPRYSDQKRSEVAPLPGVLTEVFADFGLTDGKRVCVKMHMQAQGAIDQRTQLQQLFNSPGFHINRRSGGVIILNPRHITRWAMYPGPANAPMTAWKLHRTDERSQWNASPSVMVQKLRDEEELDSGEIPSSISVAVRSAEPEPAPAPMPSSFEDTKAPLGPVPIPPTAHLADTDSKAPRRVLKFGKK